MAICPHGDLRLLVGSDKTCLQVSSHVLCLASDVFKTMLHGGFVEAHALQQANSESPLDIVLPDDDSRAMTIILNILHLQFAKLPSNEDMTLDTLASLILLVDKYNLREVTVLQTREWLLHLQKQAVKGHNREDVERHLALAHAVGEVVCFGVASVHLILTQSHPFELPRKDPLLATLPETVYDHLTTARNELNRAIEVLLLEGASGDGYETCNDHSVGGTCIHHTLAWSDMLQTLRDEKVYPPSRETSVASILQALRLTSDDDIRDIFDFDDGPSYSCDGVNVTALYVAEELSKKILNAVKGLCLHCISPDAANTSTCFCPKTDDLDGFSVSWSM